VLDPGDYPTGASGSVIRRTGREQVVRSADGDGIR
jgi:hypothetical protein